MPTAEESNHSAVGVLHPHYSATFFLYVTLRCLIHQKVPIGYNGMSHINPQNCPFLWGDWHPVYLPYPWPTHHPKCHQDQISRFPQSTGQTERPTDRSTDGSGNKSCTNNCLHSTNDSDVANNNNTN